MGQTLSKVAASRTDLVLTLNDLAEHFGPAGNTRGTTLAEIINEPTPMPTGRPAVGTLEAPTRKPLVSKAD